MPGLFPAVNTTALPVAVLKFPSVLFVDQEYVIPVEGQDANAQTGVAVNCCEPHT